MVQAHRAKRFLFSFFFFFLSSCVLFLCCLSEASTDGSAMSLQYLSREELARVAGYGEEALSSVLVAGTVVCDACLAGEAEFHTSYVQGAKVGIKCRTEGMRRKISWAHGTTDDYGDFIVHLPSHLHGNPSLESACIVRVVRAPKASPCRGVRVRSKRVKLSSVGNNIRVYTAGVVRLKNAISTTGLCTMRRRHEAENNVL